MAGDPVNNIRSAIVKRLTDANIFPANAIAWENKKFDPKGADVWAMFSFVVSEAVVASLGNGCDDRISGYAQIDIQTLLDKGVGAAGGFVDKIRDIFPAGQGLNFNGVAVTISRTAFTTQGVVYDETYWRTPLFIYFYSHVQRNKTN